MNKKKTTYFILMLLLFLGNGFLLINFLEQTNTIWLIAISLLIAMLSDKFVTWLVDIIFSD